MAEAVASAVRGVDLLPLLASSSVPTPSCSWGVVEENALGALVITASHNPCEWLGLKIKDIVFVSLKGVYDKKKGKPSSEWRFHQDIYVNKNEAKL